MNRDAEAELFAVMVSVDKWFAKDDPRLELNPATRAVYAREIALKEIERLDAGSVRREDYIGAWMTGKPLASEIPVFDIPATVHDHWIDDHLVLCEGQCPTSGDATSPATVSKLDRIIELLEKLVDYAETEYQRTR